MDWLKAWIRPIKKPIQQAIIQSHRRSGRIMLSDTTLRDGEQMPGATLEPEEKREIALALETAGIHSLDAGFPASSQQDFDAIRLMAQVIKRPVMTALCRTVEGDVDAADEALAGLPPHKRGVSLFIGTSPLHREYKLRKSRTEVLSIIDRSVRYASKKFDIVAFSPEDASRTEADFLVECYETAIQAGATTIGYPDTVGVLTPERAYAAIRHLLEHVPSIRKVLVAVHMHNDLGLAVANSLAGLTAGAHIVQCTVNGIGERAGNAALEEVAMALYVNQEQYGRPVKLNYESLFPLCQLVAKKTGVPMALNKPVAGRTIFATEAGIHQDGLLKHPDTYLPYRPEVVGGPAIELVLGRHSGKGAVAHHLQNLGYQATDANVMFILNQIKGMPRGVLIDKAQIHEWMNQKLHHAETGIKVA